MTTQKGVNKLRYKERRKASDKDEYSHERRKRAKKVTRSPPKEEQKVLYITRDPLLSLRPATKSADGFLAWTSKASSDRMTYADAV